MTVIVDPKIQEQYDRNVAEHRAATAEVSERLKARQQEIADQVAANKAADAALGRELAEAAERGGARHPSAAELEEHDISARAEDYQEPEEEDLEAPPAPAPAPYRPPVAEEDEVGTFRWDDDVPPPRPAPRRARRDTDEDLSEHDWLE